jgi:YesN/AraC family two-component response regulator
MEIMDKQVLDDFVPHISSQVFRKCAQDWRIWQTQVEDYDLTYVIKGGASFTVNGITHELQGGDLLFLTEGDMKEAVTYPQNLMQYFAVNFTAKYQKSKNTGSGATLFPMLSHIGLRQDIIDMFREMNICWAEQQDGYIMKSRALLMLIIHRLSEIIVYNVDAEPGDYRIGKITRYIALHYAEKLTVKNMARQVRLDLDYFGQLFKRETGMTVHQYITKVRIRNAENMLQSGNYKVQEVAEHCGFNDVFYFYKSFKALRGFPPSRCIPK